MYHRRTNGCTPSPRVSLGQWLPFRSDRVIRAVELAEDGDLLVEGMTRRKKPNGVKPKRRRRPAVQGKLSHASKQEQVFSLQATDEALAETGEPVPMWMDEQGVHALLPGSPEADTYERLTEQYKQNIRNSPMWDEMVRQFGLEKAEQLLKQCRAKPG
jgi:hypothetical protein